MSTVIGIISLVAGLAGSVASANAQSQAADAEKKAGLAEQRANEFNASLREKDAEQTRQAAMWEESKSRDESRALISKQRAMYARSGVALDEGSPLLIMADTAAQAEKDALAIRWQGDTAYAAGMNEAELMRLYGRNAAEGAGFRSKSMKTAATATVLSGLGQAGKAYGSGNTTGVSRYAA
jgi:hypothetical protein